MGDKLGKVEAEFHAAMQDDFNTAKAVGHLFELARAVNRVAEGGDNSATAVGARALVRLGNLLGLFVTGPRQEAQWPPEVTALVGEREEARKRKDWESADRLRDRLHELGVVVEDVSGGSRLQKK